MFAACILHVLSCAIGVVKNPVILVPGLSGSVLDAKISDRPPIPSGHPGTHCATKSDWFLLWASVEQTIENTVCFTANMKLEISKDANVTNASSVAVVPRDFGGLDGVDFIDPGTVRVGYMHALITALEKTGYQRNVSLRAAPFDWRVTGIPSLLHTQQQQLQELIEDTVALNQGQPAVLVAHSLGADLVNHFLAGQSAEWKSKHVAKCAYLAAPLKGTPAVFQDIIAGPRLGTLVPQFVPEKVVEVVKTFPSMLWMLPSPSEAGFWGAGDAFIRTPNQNYGLQETGKLLSDINATVLKQLWEVVQPSFDRRDSDPGVEVFCAFANDSDTPFTVQFPNQRFEGAGEVVNTTKGDGTVSIQSLRWCRQWPKAVVHEYELHAGEGAHVKIVSDQKAIEDLVLWL